MAKCRSWRYTLVESHQGHLPGTCRECWKPCREKVEPGVVRCNDCLIAIVSCRDTKVRRGLMQEEGVDERTLELLIDDANPVLAATATARLAEMRALQDSTDSGVDADAGSEISTITPDREETQWPAN